MRVFYLCGSDQAFRTKLYKKHDLQRWCDGVVIISRPGEGWQELKNMKLPDNFFLIDTNPAQDCSSSQVRHLLAKNEDISAFVPKEVARFIEKGRSK